MTNSVTSEESVPGSVRHDHRVTVPLTVVIDGRRHKTQDWSFGGFRIVDFGDQMREGDELSGQLVLPYRDSTLHIDIRFRVAWRAKIDVGCHFLELPRTARLALQHLLQDAMEGKLPAIESALGAVESEESVTVGVAAEEEGETPAAALQPQRPVKIVNPYFAAAAVVLIVALLLLSRNLAFTDTPSVAPGPVPESAVSRLDPLLSARPARPGSVTFPLIDPAEAPPTTATRDQEPSAAEPSAAESSVATTPSAPEFLSGETVVQLGAFGSEDGAWRFADEVASKSPELPDGVEYRLRPMNPRDPDSLIRLLVGPLATPASGENLCAQFLESGYDCIVRAAGWLDDQP